VSYIKISVLGEDKNIAKLKKLPAIVKPIVVSETAKYLVEYGGGYALRFYPPARAQSSYIRTFKLKAGWKTYAESSHAYITNAVPYAPFPMGDPPAAKMRLLGWRGAMERVQVNLSKAVAYAQKKVSAVIGSL
jgi:hypothetical protein